MSLCTGGLVHKPALAGTKGTSAYYYGGNGGTGGLGLGAWRVRGCGYGVGKKRSGPRLTAAVMPCLRAFFEI